MVEVSVIVINYNTPDLTSDCINSLINHTKDIVYEVIVVDNGSEKRFDFTQFDHLDNFKYVYSPKNLGFAGGNNLGISCAKGDYILLLNSDTIISENSVKTLYDCFRREPRSGSLTPKLLSPDGSVQPCANRAPSLRLELRQLLRINKFTKPEKLANLYLGARHDYNKPVECDWIYGACFFTSKAMIDNVFGGKLPETFFMYAEDMLWCLMLKKAGYTNLYTPETSIIHLGGASMNAMDEEEKYFRYMLPNVFKTVCLTSSKLNAYLIIFARILLLVSQFNKNDWRKAKRFMRFVFGNK